MKSQSSIASPTLWKTALAVAVPMLFAAQAANAASSWAATATAAHTDGLEAAISHGELPAGQPIHIVVSLSLRDRAGLDGFIGELSRPGSPAYGSVLTPEAFTSLYAPTAAQAKAVADYLSKAGFVNIEIAPNRLLVSADGSAATVKSAFNTRVEGFEVGGRSVFANTLPAQVPKSLGGSVLAVLGLQNVVEAHSFIHGAGVQPDKVSPDAGTATGHNPTTFPAIYGVGSTPTGSLTPIGILAEGNITQTITDLRTFESQNSIPQVTVNTVTIGSATTDTSGVAEWDLDSQDATAMAGNYVQSLTFYVIPSLSNANLTSGFSKVVSANAVKILNVSLGECESSANGDGSMASDDQLFAQGVAEGMTFSISTGDSGSAECGRRKSGQSYPAVSPYVVALGGTTLYTTSGAYTSESAWVSGGGGPSIYEAKPSWQSGVGSSSFRSVPDVAFDADPNSGAIIIVNGKSAQYGGTSLSAPLFVGTFARFQSANNNTLVSPNPKFYQYATSGGLFNDVTTGSNGAYTATTGWDYTTGWGSPKIATDNSFILSHTGF